MTSMFDMLAEMAGQAEPHTDSEVKRLIRQEQSVLARVETASEKLSRQVHLFPAPGVTPGSAGLLLALPARTVVVAGDAVVTRDYYEAGRVFEQAAVVADAQESFCDIAEIADEIVPGHDNVFSVIGR